MVHPRVGILHYELVFKKNGLYITTAAELSNPNRFDNEYVSFNFS